jgi:hypothetical protein
MRVKIHGSLKSLACLCVSTTNGAKRLMQTEGLSERCQLVAGDCLEVVPIGGDAYMMKHIIHVFDDPWAIAVLKNCRPAMRIFAYVVATWLLVIILNLLAILGYFDVALRDLGLMLGALALGRLSQNFDRA